MDDQLLEKRLDSLKKAYNEMPEEENRSAILAAIKKDQKKKRTNKWLHLPYAASFIGVGMIAGVLMMQYIGDHIPSGEKTEQRQASGENAGTGLKKADVKAEFEELRSYYTEKQKDTKEKLGLGAGFEKWLFLSMEELKGTEANMLDNLDNTSQVELELEIKQLKGTIDESFTLPGKLIEEISKGDPDEKVGRREELLSLQLESYLGAYMQSMVFHEWDLNQATEQEGVTAVLEKLNRGGKGLASANLRKLAASAVENGYAFREEDGRILPYIDFIRVAERLKPNGNKDFIKYLVLRSNKIQDRNGVVMSYQKLGELLVKLERESFGVKDSMIHQTMMNDAQSLYALFVIGSPLNSLFDENNLLKGEVKKAYQYVIDLYPDTDTAKALETHYVQLEKAGFKKPADGDLHVELYPEYLQIPAPQGRQQEEKFIQSIYLLPEELLAAYKGFSVEKDFDILRDFGPFEIMQLYFYADSLEDYGTKYALYSKNGEKPPEDRYIKEQQESGHKLGELLRGYEYGTLYQANDTEEIVGVQMHFKNPENNMVFQVIEEDEGWKVRYMPFQ
ncbi:hypothetical protein [Mesobacillus subterraneus]|uniref:Uncharacterized protein n=1 Tax=Mesobacillus subterraneus TaxID=285983 RepID=A0A427TT87_9BACI|nr:hypothetical protein [Mesobacillus subterraneus]RSD27559.1 hypothetical protein EJA10_09330 [Mesobacillus subterraneus]